MEIGEVRLVPKIYVQSWYQLSYCERFKLGKQYLFKKPTFELWYSSDFQLTCYNIQRDIHPTFDVTLCVNSMLKSNYARDSYLNTGNLSSVVLVKDIRGTVYVKANLTRPSPRYGPMPGFLMTLMNFRIASKRLRFWTAKRLSTGHRHRPFVKGPCFQSSTWCDGIKYFNSWPLSFTSVMN